MLIIAFHLILITTRPIHLVDSLFDQPMNKKEIRGVRQHKLASDSR